MSNVRIPKDLIPERYNINLFVDIKNIEYMVKYDIDLLVANPTSYLILNAIPEFYKIHKKRNQVISIIKGEIVEVGPGEMDKNGKRIEMQVKKGQKVLLPEFGG